MADHAKGNRYTHGSAKTCQSCAKAKIRCVRQGAAGSCDRCDRLGKICHYRDSRNVNTTPERSEGKDRRIDALEAKLDQLLAHSSFRALKTDGSGSEESPGNVPTNAPTSAPGLRKDVIEQGILTIHAADTLLKEYRAAFAPYCPFVMLPPQMTAEKLRREKPFLFLAILTATLCDNMPLQRKLETEVKKATSECLIFDGPVSFEVLQGILVHIAWSQYHSRPRRVSQYLHLAISIIIDLQLDRAPEYRFRKHIVSFDGEDKKDSVSWGREEQRAVIGCFYFSSTISQILQKRCSFPYSPYIESLGILLATEPEYSSDRYLLHIVQLQKISERIVPLSTPVVPEIHDPNLGIEHHYRELKTDLVRYQANLPFPLTENYVLFMQFHAVELYLCQITLLDHKPALQDQRHGSGFQVEVLCMGLTAAKTLLDFYICLPLRCDLAFNNATWIQLGFAAILACKLAITAMEPSVYLHTTEFCCALDISNVLSRCILRIQALITSDMDASGDRDVFYHFEKRLKRLQWWFENRALSGRKNEASQLEAQLAEGLTPSSGGANQYLDASQPPLDGFHTQFQWSELFPGASIDEIYVDWMI